MEKEEPKIIKPDNRVYIRPTNPNAQWNIVYRICTFGRFVEIRQMIGRNRNISNNI